MQNLVSTPDFEREQILPTANGISGSVTNIILKASYTESQRDTKTDMHLYVCEKGETNAKTD